MSCALQSASRRSSPQRRRAQVGVVSSGLSVRPRGQDSEIVSVPLSPSRSPSRPRSPGDCFLLIIVGVCSSGLYPVHVPIHPMEIVLKIIRERTL